MSLALGAAACRGGSAGLNSAEDADESVSVTSAESALTSSLSGEVDDRERARGRSFWFHGFGFGIGAAPRAVMKPIFAVLAFASGVCACQGVVEPSAFLSKVREVVQSAKCPSGGVALSNGKDLDGDGQLSAAETTSESEVCSGTLASMARMRG